MESTTTPKRQSSQIDSEIESQRGRRGVLKKMRLCFCRVDLFTRIIYMLFAV